MESDNRGWGLCATCKSLSRSSGAAKRGFCLKKKTATALDDTCGYYKPDVKKEYKIECKMHD